MCVIDFSQAVRLGSAGQPIVLLSVIYKALKSHGGKKKVHNRSNAIWEMETQIEL